MPDPLPLTSPDWMPGEPSGLPPNSRLPAERELARTREFEREEDKEKESEPAFAGDASLEAILQELKERGIGQR